MASENTNGNAVRFFNTGASIVDGAQPDADASLGGNRSSSEVMSIAPRRYQPLAGIVIEGAAGKCGTGIGILSASTTDTVTWTAPGDTIGAAVTIANGETKVIESADTDKWIIITRSTASYLTGKETVYLVDVMNNAAGGSNFTAAQTTAGAEKYRCVIAHNGSGLSVTGLRFWLDSAAAATVRIGGATVTAGVTGTTADEDTEPSPAPTWYTGTAEGVDDLNIGTVTAGADTAIWIERSVAALASAATFQDVVIHYSYTYSGTKYTGSLRGIFHQAEAGIAGLGIWIGQDASPDLSAAPDEFFQYDTTAELEAALPFSSAAAVDPDHTYQMVYRWRNQYGLWSARLTEDVIVVNADASEGNIPPTAPENVTVETNSAGGARVSARYYPAPDGTHRAHMFIVWLNTDGTTPDPDLDTPTGYQLMGGQSGVELLTYDTAELTQGASCSAILKSRAIADGTGTEQDTDTDQLPASGAGTIETSGSFSTWDASGYAAVYSVTSTGKLDGLKEIIEYSSRTATVLTIDAAGRGLWGTTAVAGTDTQIVKPIIAVDSAETAEATSTIDKAVITSRPSGIAFFGTTAAANTSAIVTSGIPDDTVIYLNESDNIFALLNPGSTSIYMDAQLMWRCIYDSGASESNCVYIPSEVTLDVTEITDACGFSGHGGTFGNPQLKFAAGGEWRVYANESTLTITAEGVDARDGNEMPETNVTGWYTYNADGWMLLVWDPTAAKYVCYWQITSAGIVSNIDLNNTLTQAQIEAL